MKTRTLKHPRKVIWAMKDFLNEASDLTYESLKMPSYNECIERGINPDDLLAIFEAGEIVAEKRMCVLFKNPIHQKGFAAIVGESESPTFRITYNLDQLSSQGQKQFRQDFVNRCPLAKGFANITLTLLHELGHLETETEEMEEFDRELAIAMIEMFVPREERNFMYFKMPDETKATDWAIQWLQNAENRKIAKAFEKKFFACFN